MEFRSITHYFFNGEWIPNPLPTTFLMSNGIPIHYPLLFYWVMEFESITHYFSNE